MAPSVLALLLLLISLATAKAALSAADATSRIALSKSPNYPSSFDNPWESISRVTRSSLTRARHLKRRPVVSDNVKLPTYPRSYGGYSIHLSLGTPSQPVSLVMDTASSLVWTPCSTNRSRYSCLNCTFSGVDPPNIPTYKLNKSSTVRIVGCKSPKCGWVFGSGFKCRDCSPKHSNCTLQKRCPEYIIQYGLGATVGRLVSDTLELSKKGDRVGNFLFGCSIWSERQPEGIAGFGRGSASLPAQLGLRKFSYCLISHDFDDSPKSGDLVLYGGRGGGFSGNAGGGVSYAPFRKSPAVSPYSEYYYVALRRIIVGSKIIPFPSRYLVPSAKGNGGVIVDSGSTFTFMERAIHDPVALELEKQMRRYKRAKDIEEKSGLGPCYNITGENDVEIPKLALLFNGGARMDFPLANYFSFIGGPSVVCMTVLTDTNTESPAGLGVPSGPAMILGNYQQQNFYVEYDLENQRLGFKAQQCGQGRN